MGRRTPPVNHRQRQKRNPLTRIGFAGRNPALHSFSLDGETVNAPVCKTDTMSSTLIPRSIFDFMRSYSKPTSHHQQHAGQTIPQDRSHFGREQVSIGARNTRCNQTGEPLKGSKTQNN